MLRERRMTSRERGEGRSVVMGRGLKYLGCTPRPRGGPRCALSCEPHSPRPRGDLDPGLLLCPSAPAPSGRGGDPAGTSPGGGANLPSSSGRWFPEPFLSRGVWRPGGRAAQDPRCGWGCSPTLSLRTSTPSPRATPPSCSPPAWEETGRRDTRRCPARLSPTALTKLPARPGGDACQGCHSQGRPPGC